MILAGVVLPYGVLIACLACDLDGPYWLLEDIAPDPECRSRSISVLIYIFRIVTLLFGFLETSRFIIGISSIFLFGIYIVSNILNTLLHKSGIRKFIKYYVRLSLICIEFEKCSMRGFFLSITAEYLLLIQTLWILIEGWGKLDIFVYCLFLTAVLQLIGCAVVFLPKVTAMGELICSISKIKYAEACRIYRWRRGLIERLAVKRAKSLIRIRFSYGSFYPLGKKFTRNTFENFLENLLTTLLLFDLNWVRYTVQHQKLSILDSSVSVSGSKINYSLHSTN